MNNLRFYQSVYPGMIAKDMYFAPFSQLDKETLTAQVIQYGAVNANTKNKEQAWNLLKYILDAPASMAFSKYQEQTIYYAPVNAQNYEACVNELAGNPGMGPVRLQPLTVENTKILQALPERIASGVIPNAALGELIQECMEPYLLGTASFDSCYEELIHRAELYSCGV